MDTSKPLELLTIDEACAEIRIDKSTLYRAMGDGRLPAQRVAGTEKVLIFRADLLKMLEVWTPKAKGFARAKKVDDPEAGE